jgi:hypothetical protein
MFGFMDSYTDKYCKNDKKKASVMIGLVIRIPTKFSLNFYDFSIIFYEFRKFELIFEMNKRNKEIENNEA